MFLSFLWNKYLINNFNYTIDSYYTFYMTQLYIYINVFWLVQLPLISPKNVARCGSHLSLSPAVAMRQERHTMLSEAPKKVRCPKMS